jgi:hypothetical protein
MPAPYKSKLHPKLNTTGHRDVTVLEIKARAAKAKKRIGLNTKRLQIAVTGPSPANVELLVWDQAGQQLTSAAESSRLWSTSTHFSIKVNNSPSVGATDSTVMSNPQGAVVKETS